ncbi:MAG TPA: cytochrome b [Burkholderiaceae bacterium]|nr:cytochrome b [Burkholderiaceae bacterium]
MPRPPPRHPDGAYTSTARWLHWLVAALILANLALGLTMVGMPGISPTKLRYFNWHKWVGVTVFALALLRLAWRWRHPAPALPDAMPAWERRAAMLSHAALYLLMFVVPLSGYFYSLAAGFPVVYLGVLPLPVLIEPDPQLKQVLVALHHLLAWTLLALLLVHVAAALKHGLVDHDGVLQRMLPRWRRG